MAWNSPGIARVSSGREAKFVAHDGPVAASFSGEGIALSHATQGTGLRWTLDGAKTVPPVPSAPLAGRINDLRGDAADWKTEQPTYGRMEYAGVYPGVTLSVETRRHGVAYRFDVAAGADPAAIRMRYTGADEVAVEEGGKALRVRWGRSSLRERGLRCFQQIDEKEKDVDCRYAGPTDGVVVALQLGPYDRTRPLVIDPEILWGTYLGGSSTDTPRAVAVDAAGNIYVAGHTYSTNFPTSVGGYDRSAAGSSDTFLTKLDPSGSSILWSTYLGGVGSEYGHGVGVDASGNAYVAGYTTSSDFPTTGGFDTSLSGFYEAYVARFTSTGALSWSSYLGGSSDDIVYALTVDSVGDAYLTGYTFSADFPTTGGFDTSFDGGMETFVTRVTSAGVLSWSTYLGGNSSDYGYGLAVDGNDDVYVAGYTYSSDFPVPGGFDTTLDSLDAFVTKITNGATPSIEWSSFLGGISSDQAQALAVDGAGNAYVTGYTDSSDFPTVGGFDSTIGSFRDIFVTKVDLTGASLVWSTYLGGEMSWEEGTGIVADSTGGVTVSGRTFSADFPASGGFDNSYNNGDAFVVRFDGLGALDWSSFLGGQSTDYGWALALGPNDNPVAVGETYSTDFPVVDGYAMMHSGGSDGTVVRIAACGNTVCETVEDPCTCPDDCGADTCGNGCCGALENTGNCESDCPDRCGNTFCGSAESACTCPEDCGADICGNGCCGELETECTCADDCDDHCGDGCCTGGETPCGCPSDCPGAGECGNGCRDPGESACTCPEDTLDLCGDGCCTGEETCSSCSDDCGGCPEIAPDAGEVEEPTAGGCGCRVASSVPSVTAAWLALAALAFRRRRR